MKGQGRSLSGCAYVATRHHLLVVLNFQVRSRPLRRFRTLSNLHVENNMLPNSSIEDFINGVPGFCARAAGTWDPCQWFKRLLSTPVRISESTSNVPMNLALLNSDGAQLTTPTYPCIRLSGWTYYMYACGFSLPERENASFKSTCRLKGMQSPSRKPRCLPKTWDHHLRK